MQILLIVVKNAKCIQCIVTDAFSDSQYMVGIRDVRKTEIRFGFGF